MNSECKGKDKHDCGKFKGNEDKEAKLKHLKECKEGLQAKIVDINKAIEALEN